MNRKEIMLCKFHVKGFPEKPVGAIDVAELLGISRGRVRETVYKGLPVCGVDVEALGPMAVKADRTCIRCGRVLGHVQSTVFCEECRRDNRAKGLERRADRERYSGNSKKKYRHEVPPSQKSPLALRAWEARQLGMSYGEYMTWRTARWFS